MHAPGPVGAQLTRRVAVLEGHFRQIAAQRMRGLPLLNPALQVQAVGFAAHAWPEAEAAPPRPSGQVGSTARQLTQQGQGPQWAAGVLITPWFMNLVRLPLAGLSPEQALEAGWLGPGERAARRVGCEQLDFLGAVEGDAILGELGAFETCSLFSPMFEFADHPAAVATATEVLRLLREPVSTPAPAAAPATAPVPAAIPAPPPSARAATPAPPPPARRGFLFGRSAVQGEGRR